MKLHAVLVRSEYASNVGAAARALANMGGDRLILIDPRCDLKEERAKQMAAGAQPMLTNATVYTSWDEFYSTEPDGVRIALTRRAGRARKVGPLGDKIAELKSAPPADLYMIFGPEADGLADDDLAFVNFCCHLPVYGDFASLNLAQAVLLALFQVRQHIEPSVMPKQVTGEQDEPVQPFYFPDQLIRDWLTSMGFDIDARKSSAYLTLRRLFMANQPTRHEYQVLEAILQQNVRKLKE